MNKLLVLLSASLFLFACGKDPSETPSPTNDKSGDKVYSQVFTVSGKNKQSYNIHNNINCYKKKHRKLNQAQTMRKYQELCQQAAPIAENTLKINCDRLGGSLENIELSSNTEQTSFGHCKSLHCEISATASCGIE